MTPASIIPVFGSQRPYADLNFAGGSFGLDGRSVSDLTALPGFTFTRASTAMFYGSSGLLQTAGSGVARFAYNPVTLASQGILVEEARTNSVLQSNTFDNASWTKAGATITANSTTSPDGTTNAAKFADAGAGANHFVYQLYTVTNGSTWTHSVYAKKGSFSWFIVNPFNSTNYRTWFNLDTGVVGVNAAGNTASITSVGNGWYRCSVTRTMVGTAAYVELELASADGVVATTVGDVFIYGAQAELGTGASSPIPTTTASVTRAADVALLAVTGATYPMSVVATFTRAFDNGASDFVYQIDGGSSANRVTGTVNGSDLAASSMTTASSGQGLSTSADTVSVGSLTKMATRFDVAGIQLALNGTLATPTSPVTLPSAPTTARIGLNDTASNPGNLMLARLQIYNRALSDAQLQSLTT